MGELMAMSNSGFLTAGQSLRPYQPSFGDLNGILGNKA